MLLIGIVILTVVTQIGGIVLLVSLVLFKLVDKRIADRFSAFMTKVVLFLLLYIISVFTVVPWIARPLGRVPLPLMRTNHLQPGNPLTFFLNRNYVKPQLRETAYAVAEEMDKKHPGTVLNYLDANFPFRDKFPLLPHRSHNDGKKLDLSFLYTDSKTGEQTDRIPSFTGYGICEGPDSKEENMPLRCEEKGYWQYSLLQKLVSQNNKEHFNFDGKRTKTMVTLFAAQPGIGRIFIEPHLKTRLRLTSNKIKFHGCQAVRHDDHLHVQLK